MIPSPVFGSTARPASSSFSLENRPEEILCRKGQDHLTEIMRVVDDFPGPDAYGGVVTILDPCFQSRDCVGKILVSARLALFERRDELFRQRLQS